MHVRTTSALVILAVTGLLGGAGLAVAGAGANDIVFTFVPGLPFGMGGRFTDPSGFACADGSAPFHNPPVSFERRCQPTYAGAATCSALEAQGTIAGAFGGSTLEVNASCSNDRGAGAPELAACLATGPGFPATCSAGPSAGSVATPYTFFCHVRPSGAALFFGATCSMTAS